MTIISRTKKLKVLNPLISEDIFALDSTLDISTRLKSSCSNENECTYSISVFMKRTVVIGTYLKLNYAVSIRRYQFDDFVFQSCLILICQSDKG